MIPPNLAKFPRDKRGYPIHFTVTIGKDGNPLFNVVDLAKAGRCARERLCFLCGQGLGKKVYAIGGPLSATDPKGAFTDGPMHYACADYALSVCPWLVLPKMRYMPPPGADKVGLVITDETQNSRPERFALVRGSGFSVVWRGPQPVFVLKAREVVEWIVPGERRREAATPEDRTLSR